MTEHAVVVAGGGPTGLMLAGELSDRIPVYSPAQLRALIEDAISHST